MTGKSEKPCKIRTDTKVMDLLTTATYIKADGSEHQPDEVFANAEIVCLYFSAHWCPPCRAFTPILKDFYEEVSGNGVQVIFVSSDRNPEDQISYMKQSHGDWFALKHGCGVAAAVKKKYEISGIPALVVISKSTGALITKQGRPDVQSKGPDCVKAWKSS